jgi:hypothetical protein
MVATYTAALLVCASSLAIGQAAICLCGARRWSWLSPAVGLALLCAVCWGTVRLPGNGLFAVLLVAALAVGSLMVLRGRVEAAPGEGRLGAAVALVALVAASVPFAAEGHFGILGTGFNPDMSQHLLAADRLAHGDSSQLLVQGYPLGPHAVVVALNKGLGIGLVQGFDGLTIAVAVLASLTALAAFSEQRPALRGAAALLVALAYMVASYFAQGAFKETMQALIVLAFVLALREAGRDPLWRPLALRFVPAALLAAGSVYIYSYPGLIWPLATVCVWAALELASSRTRPGPAALRSGLLAFLLFAVLVAPEIGRMVEFRHFETFDPNGPGLGNLFGQISPFEALGIWPSGDFRLAPGDGAAPAFAYYLGAAFAAILLVYGAYLCRRRRETALLAGLLGAVAVYAISRLSGTPYTTAKAVEVAAPIAVLVILLPLLRRPVAILYLLLAGACSLLAFANAPIGPSDYSPALTGLRPLLASDSTLVLASPRLLADEQGDRYIAWELRGGRVCILAADEAGERLPRGVRFVVTEGGSVAPPYAGMRLNRRAGPYVLWETARQPHGPSDCPLIAVRQARQGPGG